MLLQCLAALVDRDRLGERHVAALEAADDLLQFGEGLLEAERLDRRQVGHVFSQAVMRAATWVAAESASAVRS